MHLEMKPKGIKWNDNGILRDRTVSIRYDVSQSNDLGIQEVFLATRLKFELVS